MGKAESPRSGGPVDTATGLLQVAESLLAQAAPGAPGQPWQTFRITSISRASIASVSPG